MGVVLPISAGIVAMMLAASAGSWLGEVVARRRLDRARRDAFTREEDAR